MEGKSHIIISSLAAPIAVLTLTDATTIPEFTILYFLAVAAGTLIDLDHFFVYRYETGDWRDLKKALNKPKAVLEDFSTLTVYSSKKKYVMHTVTFLAVMNLSYLFLRNLAALIVAMMSLHMLSDLYSSFEEKEYPFHKF